MLLLQATHSRTHQATFKEPTANTQGTFKVNIGKHPHMDRKMLGIPCFKKYFYGENTMAEYYKPDVWDRLWPILRGRNGNDIIYVYRAGPDGRLVKPLLVKSGAFPDFLEWLRDNHGHGEYRLLIRRGRTMIFSGNINI